jgi:hypothetical protein
VGKLATWLSESKYTGKKIRKSGMVGLPCKVGSNNAANNGDSKIKGLRRKAQIEY